jgi:hypothetical protein
MGYPAVALCCEELAEVVAITPSMADYATHIWQNFAPSVAQLRNCNACCCLRAVNNNKLYARLGIRT